MATYTQENRLLSVNTPLGKDVLLLTGFSGREAMSRLFSYQLEMFSEDEGILPKDLVGKPVAWAVQKAPGGPRYFHGIVSRFVAGHRILRKLRTYRAQVVPWLWFLTRTANCRIFQNKTAPEIIQAVFKGLGFSDLALWLREKYPKREYCVQYQETAFRFVSRLLEQEGIFYYFRHDKDKHTLVLVDRNSACPDCPEASVPYTAGTLTANHVLTWERRFEFRSGSWAQTDYNFETPSTNLLSASKTGLPVKDMEKYEVFNYPGRYQVKADGDAQTRVRMEEEEAGYEVAAGTSKCPTFMVGGKFTLATHEIEAEAGKGYLLTSVQHTATDPSYFGTGREPAYDNQFTCIPAAVPFRTERLTRRPVVRGPQTAVVVGPSGEEIYTDKYGRVKVQFFWDREGKKDENSSCWVRVAEAWAGKNWGAVFNPRVGQEVVVEFLEGDPDRPLITGRVYNADQTPPYPLPANQTQSGVKSRSSKKGGADNFNELRFEDKKDSEDIYFHAEKDFHRVVEHDDDLKVGHDQTTEVKNNRTETVKEGDEKVTVEKGQRTVVVQKDDTHQVKQGDRKVTIEMGNDTLQIKTGNQTTKIDLGKSSTEAMRAIELKVGQSSIKIDQMGVTIKGMVVKIEGELLTQLKGLMAEVNGDGLLEVKGGIIMIN
jgi:type VI secretion system secreted protein VgrG